MRSKSNVVPHVLMSVALVAAICSITSAGESRIGGPTLEVSLPHFALKPNERIIGFKVALNHLVLERVKTPVGWNVEIVNEGEPSTSVVGSIILGVASLRSSDLNYFDGFLDIYEEKEVPLDIDIELSITNNSEEGTSRTLKFSAKDLRTKRSK